MFCRVKLSVAKCGNLCYTRCIAGRHRRHHHRKAGVVAFSREGYRIATMQIIDIIGRNWKVTLPTGKPGKPDEIKMPALATYTGPPFFLNVTGDGVTFVV